MENEKTVYFRDVDNKDVLVRKRESIFELEYIGKANPVWIKTTTNDPYEREVYFGEGDTCLDPITYEEAKQRLLEWGVQI